MSETKQGGNAQGFVTVALKSQNGLWLRAFERQSKTEPVMGGGSREYDVFVEHEKLGRHEIHGVAAPFGMRPRVNVIGGYAINRDVPARLWDVWREQNAEHPLVVNGLIFAFPNARDTEVKARDGATLKSGLEPLMRDVTDRDGRVLERDKRISGGVAREPWESAA